MDPITLGTGSAIGYLVSAIGAIGALGTAAAGLVDATKAFGGGVSLIGFAKLKVVLKRFAAALDSALPTDEWQSVVRAHWINGRPQQEQKAIVKALIRLGLAPTNAAAIAPAAHVDVAALTVVATKLQDGTPLVEADLNILGRLDASVELQLGAAFDAADQQYRNASRVIAGVFSVALALFTTWAANMEVWGLAVVVGLLAVPLAPIAKDLASSLQSAAQAVKVAKGRP